MALKNTPNAFVSAVVAVSKSRTFTPVKNGVIIDPMALTCRGTPASRAASASPAARSRPIDARRL